MESKIDWREVYEAFRDAGLVKLFETMNTRFFMGIASSLTKPITGEELIHQISNPGDGEVPISTGTGLREFLDVVIKPEDKLRYHVIVSDAFVIHYIFLYDRGLKGTIPDMDDADEAVTRMRFMVSAEEIPEAGLSDGLRVEAVMILGNGAEYVNDETRGAILKHELTHILIKYLMDIEQPDLLDNVFAVPSKEELSEFIEFLCDFTQFDATILNKYTVNPIVKFSEALEFIFKNGTIDKYELYMNAIAPFFNEQMGSTPQ